MLRYLLWDVDGTLFDTYPAFARAFGLLLDELEVTASLDWITGLCKRSLSHCATTLAHKFDVDVDDVLDGFSRHYAGIPAQDQPPFPGVVDVCAYVRAIGGENFIVTHRGSQSLQRLLVVHRMTDCFADRLTRDDDYPRKPDPASFEEMIHRHGLEREAVLAVGDRDIDVLAGRAAGVRTCLFGAVVPGVEADYSIADYAELYRLLVAENGGMSSPVA